MSKTAEKEIKKSEKNNKNINENIIEFQDNNYAEKIQSLHIPRWEELPSIDLYLDQVVTLIDKFLLPYLGNEDDSILITKTMINNYVKQGIIKSPEKKKYNREHIACLFVICSLKTVYSISNISELIEVGITKFKVENSYNKFCTLFEYALKSIFKNKRIEFPSTNIKEQILLQNVIQSVAYKIYVEKTFFNK